MGAKMQEHLPKLRPSIDASETIAFAYAKGPHFAQRPRKMGVYLLQTGLLLQSNQGKGAFHESLLNNPEVISNLRQWSKGVLDAADGGFTGPVSHFLDAKLLYFEVN